MDLNCRFIIAWSTCRVTQLDSEKRYEDSYSVSQEFCEWTTSLDTYPDGLKDSILYVSDFNKENRTTF